MPFYFHRPDWMGELTEEYDKKYGEGAYRNLSITSLCIPGTHDSGTAFLENNWTENVVNAVRCQSLTIEEQLDWGIRYLDIRVKYAANTFCIVHDGPVARMDYFCVRKDQPEQFLTLTDVLETCRTFLAEHPMECVIMSIKLAKSAQQHGNELTGFLAEYDRQNQVFLDAGAYRQTGVQGYPDMGSARGKLILLRRFETEQQNPWYDFTGWGSVKPEDDGSFHIPANDDLASCALIQDMYSASLVGSLDTNAEQKVTYYLDSLKRYHDEEINPQLAPPMLLLNFLSCTKCSCIEKLANRINHKIVEHFTDGRQHTVPNGVTIMDFPGEEILDFLIGANVYLLKQGCFNTPRNGGKYGK